MAKKSTKKKTSRTAAAKDEESKAPATESDAPHVGDGDGADDDAPKATKKASVKKAAPKKKAGKKDDRRPAGAPPADHCDAEWETNTHYMYKLKFKHVGDHHQRKIKIPKK